MTQEEALDYVLTEMFKRVGEEYSRDKLVEGFYNLHTWTDSEQDDFQKWWIKELKTNSKLRRGFRLYSTHQKYLQYQTGMFLLSYGWRYKTEVEPKKS